MVQGVVWGESVVTEEEAEWWWSRGILGRGVIGGINGEA